ncbi:hypothetical protein SGCZBJ_12120 [Caulobacter zeae]|uniref:Uncharacterized protein n=1 Tax=Caulobacter zeae TaxID=2055137 RepID=A0A2N5DFY5_9CAUL|nr:hypothetical protein SGCZBJ_12120 [Caulobacter zeae]
MILLAVAGALGAAGSSTAAPRPKVFSASHQLGFSGALVTVREDYRATKWPVSSRTFVLRGASGKTLSLALANGGAGDLSTLSLYGNGDRFFLIGAIECVEFDPVMITAARCRTRPPCATFGREGVSFLGRFDWANGFDPPHGRFGLGWRFLPLEDASETSFCPDR